MIALAAASLLLATEVWIFVRTDCPISNRYAPTIAQLERDFAPRGVRFRLIYPAQETDVEKHRKEYGLDKIPASLDAKLELVRKVGVHITPEAAVFNDQGKLIYRGRIDDRQASLRVSRAPVVRDLEEVLRKPPGELRVTKAIGCAIEGLRD